MTKRLFLMLLSLFLTPQVFSQGTEKPYPSQPITLIVPAGAGGITDSLARILSDKLSSVLNQTVIVVNKAGASGIIGTEYVARAKPDGYTLLMVFPSHVVNPGLRKELPYNTIKDFSAVSKVGTVSAILLVSSDSKAKNMQDFIKMAKAQPGVLNYGSVGVGSWGDLVMTLFQAKSGIKLTHVPYKGDPQVVAALIQKDIQGAFVSPISSMAMLNAGKIRGLAIADKDRLSVLPNIPTVSESGLPGFEATGWNAIFAPAGTPKNIINKLSLAVNTSLKDPDLMKKFLSQGVNPSGCTPDELQQALEHDISTIGATLKTAGVQPI